MEDHSYAHVLAEALLEIGAVRLSPEKPFTWASGLLSPVYCDNRLVLSYPKYRSIAIQGLQKLVGQFEDTEAIAGVATAGIPHGALLADRLELPFLYVRSKAKEHGKGNKIEGLVTPGLKVVVVEDLISTGGSSLEAVKSLIESGMQVLGVVALFTYGFTEAAMRFEEAEIPFATVTDYPTLIKVALDQHLITDEQYHELAEWYQDPRNWSSRDKHLAST